jgi:hypothetical protein
MHEKAPAPLRPSRKAGGGPPSVAPAAVGAAVEPPTIGADAVDQLFAEEVRRLPGVLRVEHCGQERGNAGGAAAPTFHIYVRPGDREAEYAIYELQGQVYDRFPEAYLEVVVLDAIGAPCPDGDPGA